MLSFCENAFQSVLYLSLFDMFCEDVRTQFESIAFLFLYLSVTVSLMLW